MKYIVGCIFLLISNAYSMDALIASIEKNNLSKVQSSLSALNDHTFSIDEKGKIQQAVDANVTTAVANRYNGLLIAYEFLYGSTLIGVGIFNETLLGIEKEESDTLSNTLRILDGCFFTMGGRVLWNAISNKTNEHNYEQAHAIKGYLHKKGILTNHEPEEAS